VVIWGLPMWFFVWSSKGGSIVSALVTAGGAGAFFGLWMAAYYARGKRKHNLPDWKDFNP